MRASVRQRTVTQWAYFGVDTIADDVSDDQITVINCNRLIANLVIFHSDHSMALALKELEAQRWSLTPELWFCRRERTLLKTADDG